MTKPLRKRLPMLRMYRLPDGRFFDYIGKWDSKGNVWGKVRHESEDRLCLRIVKRSVLEQADLIPWKQQPWRSADYPVHENGNWFKKAEATFGQ